MSHEYNSIVVEPMLAQDVNEMSERNHEQGFEAHGRQIKSWSHKR